MADSRILAVTQKHCWVAVVTLISNAIYLAYLIRLKSSTFPKFISQILRQSGCLLAIISHFLINIERRTCLWFVFELVILALNNIIVRLNSDIELFIQVC